MLVIVLISAFIINNANALEKRKSNHKDCESKLCILNHYSYKCSVKMHCENKDCILKEEYHAYLSDNTDPIATNMQMTLTHYLRENDLIIIRDKNGKLIMSPAKNFTNIHNINNPIIHRYINPDNHLQTFFVIEEQQDKHFFERLKETIGDVYSECQTLYQLYQNTEPTTTEKEYNSIATTYYASEN